VIVISREITEKKAAEELIKEENKRLLELDDLRRELITRVSHELKTPLTSIYAVSQILIKADKKDPIERIWPYLEISHRGSIRLKELVKNLMDTSRFDNKKFELRLLEENLNTIITNCVKELQYLAENRQQIINVNLPKEIILILDKNRFEQVLINILSNAIKNTPINGMIFVDLNESNDYVDIIVKDTGIGITNEEKHMLFQKFGKIERYGKDLDVDIEGAGLGLYISREIVKLHGGEILVNSEGRNKGTTFVVRMLKKRSNDKV
jgi:two-component system sensor histidine kinase VicK